MIDTLAEQCKQFGVRAVVMAWLPGCCRAEWFQMRRQDGSAYIMGFSGITFVQWEESGNLSHLIITVVQTEISTLFGDFIYTRSM